MKGFKAALAAGVVGVLGASDMANATNILTFGLPGRPDSYNYQGFLTQSISGSVPTYSLLSIFSYYTPVGLTGTQRDQFQFEARGAVGIQNNQANPTDISYASPGFSLEYYYNVIEDHGVDKLSPNYFVWWTSPQVVATVPTGQQRTSGYGSNTDQWDVTIQCNNYFSIGRFAISINPVTLAYGAKNQNTYGSLVGKQNGENLTLMDSAIGYKVSKDLVLGGQIQYNLNAVANSTSLPSRDIRLGPALTYLGFAKEGWFLAANVSTDVEHSTSLKRANVTQIWIEKYF